MPTRYLALDVGGSKIEAGLVTHRGRVLAANRVPAHPGCSLDELPADMAAALSPFAGEPADGLGAGFPALGDYRRGVLHGDRSLYPCVAGFPLRDHLSRLYGLPVRMTTDANLFALGIWRFGEGRRYRDFLALTLGTGLGVGLVRGGRLEEAPRGVPAEALRVMRESASWQSHAGHHFPRLYGCYAETLAARAAAGDADAVAAFEKLGAALAETVRRLLAAYPVDAVILGGGLGKSWGLFAPALERGLRGLSLPVMRTQLAHASLLGAAAMFRS
ncbi:MAG: ROK family protein [Chloroflexi bacterium]|nr:ROK family protein [Chloroflexota bacterium]